MSDLTGGAKAGAAGSDPYDHGRQERGLQERGSHQPDLIERDLIDEVCNTVRPWGHFEQFVANEAVTVKTITVLPGHRLSLQRHGRRAELWQILDHPLDVVVGDRAWLAASGELVWVPAGLPHRVGNPGVRPGRVLEIAFGDFAEGDIERLEDDYHRD
ncbi:MAG: phosphomannose isomerase type II C-terminal cupin domain [Ornithinimicrobium sp.]